MIILIFGSPSRKHGFENPSEAHTLEDGLSVLAQGARAKDIRCSFRNPGRVIASELEPCDAIVLLPSGSMVNDFYANREAPPAVLLLQHALPPDDDTPQALVPEFTICLDGAASDDKDTWTADEIALGKPWKTLAPKILAAAFAAIRGGTSETESALRGRIAKANRAIGELRGKLEKAEVANQSAERDLAEAHIAHAEDAGTIEGLHNACSALEESLESEKQISGRLEAKIDEEMMIKIRAEDKQKKKQPPSSGKKK